MPHLAVERQVVGERHDAAVDAGPHEALLPQVLEQVAVLALLAADDRGEHGELRPGRQRQDAGDDLLARLGRDRPAALRAVPVADAGVEHAQEVVDLGDRADGRARVVAGRLLRDRDRRAQAADVVDVGLGHLPQKLPGEAWTDSRRTAAAPRHTACRTPASFCPSRDTPVRQISLLRGSTTSTLAQVVLAGTLDDDIGSGHQCAVGLSRRCEPAFHGMTPRSRKADDFTADRDNRKRRRFFARTKSQR